MRALPALFPLAALLATASFNQPPLAATLPTGGYLAAAAAELR